jgi:hypothetical protein
LDQQLQVMELQDQLVVQDIFLVVVEAEVVSLLHIQVDQLMVEQVEQVVVVMVVVNQRQVEQG